MMAINDALTSEGMIFQKKKFRKEVFYVDLIDLMDEVCTIMPLQIGSGLLQARV